MSDSNAANASTLEREKIRWLIEDLAKDDAGVRMTARAALVDLGHPSIAALVTSLLDPRQHVRWEAVKSLESIADASTAPALVSALHDEDSDVRWVAGAALVAIGGAALPSLLGGLIRHSRSVNFCRGAHHALHALADAGHKELLTPVIRALDGPEPGLAAPPMALKALRILTFGVDE